MCYAKSFIVIVIVNLIWTDVAGEKIKCILY